jgi:hypothetical protein
MAIQRHNETEINSPASVVAQAVCKGLKQSPPYYCTTDRVTPEASMQRAKRFKQPASEVGRLTLQLFGHFLAFPLALFLVTGCT